jgi:hypothetical protein
MESELAAKPPLRKAQDIEVHIVDGQCVVYDTNADRVHYLNPTAALVLELCDGSRSLEDIAALVQEAYALPIAPLDEVSRCLRSFREMKIAR